MTGAPLPQNSVYFGEISLSGAIRSVAHTQSRLKESEKLGFTSATMPVAAEDNSFGVSALKLHPSADLTALVATIAALAPNENS